MEMLFTYEILFYLLGPFIRYYPWSTEVSSVASPPIARIRDRSVSRHKLHGGQKALSRLHFRPSTQAMLQSLLKYLEAYSDAGQELELVREKAISQRTTFWKQILEKTLIHINMCGISVAVCDYNRKVKTLHSYSTQLKNI